MNRALKALGKSLVIVTGVGYGVIKAMDVLAEDVSDLSQSHVHARAETHPPHPMPDPTLERLNGVEQRLIRMEKNLEALTVPRGTSKSEAPKPEAPKPEVPKPQPASREPAPPEHFITRAELDRAIRSLSDDINSDIDHRFEVQNRSVQSLRSMIARTDELLEQVIENIESTSLTT